jgi:hypothetical protein
VFSHPAGEQVGVAVLTVTSDQKQQFHRIES